MKKEIIIMTKSAKINGFCVAGIDIRNGKWIRLVSNDVTGEGAVSKRDLTFEDGSEAEIFDIVSVECSPLATIAQSENYLYDNRYYWEKIRSLGYDEAIANCSLDNSPYIFVNNKRSLDEDEINGKSLLLAEIDNIVINVVYEFNKKKWKASFEYNGLEYNDINVGDINIRNTYTECGQFDILGKHFAVFSLTGKFELTGKYYKMLAQLF